MRQLALAALVLLAAGCIQADNGALFRAHGTNPVAFLGYDYEGLTGVPGQGAADITVDAARDTGTGVFNFTFQNHTWAVGFTHFGQLRPFQEGGVRSNFQEHGASGNGDTLLPTLHALSAGWGTGTVSVDGALMSDPAGGGQSFALHYMVTDTPVRDPSTHKVTNAAGSGPYDPAKPDDARFLQGRQVYLNIQSVAAGAPANTSINVQGTVPTAGTDETKDVATVNGSQPARINVTYTMQNAAGGLVPIPPVGQVTFQLLADGNAIDTCDVAFPPADPTQATAGCTHQLPSAPPGKYTLHVTSTLATGNAYAVTGSILQASPTLFVHVAYVDATVG
ncbi:MAG: hypothetical protein LC624_03580 [Halobacteriales archaeon]|nr:hypothetical protein [Halobacteriales archaeon]